MALNNFLGGLQDKLLNQIVIPGAHDAGIYDKSQIGGTGLTQDLNIFQQSCYGIRWFDIRIAGELVGGQVQLKAFHKAVAKEKTTPQGVQYLKGGFGGFGGRLESMLEQAKDFLTWNPSEFLIFKISKSQNIALIFDTCVQVMGNMLYRAAGVAHNLNSQQVSQLQGKLIVLVSESDAVLIRDHISRSAMPTRDLTRMADIEGVFAFRELYKDGNILPYNDNYRGLQYFGKFSQTNYYSTNLSKQKKNMKKGRTMRGTSKNAMGMMYWTLTSSVGNPFSLPVNIEKRNKKLWTDRHAQELTTIWKSGLEDSIRNHMGHARYDQTTQSHEWNGFIPNIIMLDFANPTACGTVVDLNRVASQVIDQLVSTEWSDG